MPPIRLTPKDIPDMRKLATIFLIVGTAHTANADLIFDLTTGGSFVGGAATFTQDYQGGMYTLVATSPDGDVVQSAAGLGVDGAGLGLDSLLNLDEQITFDLSWSGGSKPLHFAILDGNITVGDYSIGTDTFSSLPAQVPGTTTQFTLVPSSVLSTATLSSLSAVPEPGSFGSWLMLAFCGCCTRRRRFNQTDG